MMIHCPQSFMRAVKQVRNILNMLGKQYDVTGKSLNHPCIVTR